jgi:hypothetical protein
LGIYIQHKYFPPTRVAAPPGHRFLSVSATGTGLYGMLDNGQIIVVLPYDGEPHVVIDPDVVPQGTGQVCR